MKTIARTIFIISIFALMSLPVFAVKPTGRAATGKPKVQKVTVYINEMGYSKPNIDLKKGIKAQLTFIRQTDKTCATEIVIPSIGVNKPLPLNQAVVVSFTPKSTGEFNFTCGMNMMRGKLIVQ